jgi:alkylation response protein AidB-like acyl-CoA dehydrogenase
MDFRLTPEQEAFQSELRAWLDRNAVEVFGDYGAPRFHANDEEWARLMDWHRRLHRASYIGLAWPKEWGGGAESLPGWSQDASRHEIRWQQQPCENIR